MIAPTRGLPPDRSLLAVGAQITLELQEPTTVSQTWSRLQTRRQKDNSTPVSFGWFVLALDMLHALGVVDLRGDLLVLGRSDAAAPDR
ncbi:MULTISPECIES: ABC-three component system middle component 6 [unclassified Frankia]|uniref:ABC-three component system middle component 6 n=1 Tax=unclassified Frankia TaxID=2632575 RepID=UPI002AD595CB|nr:MULTISPECIES: ABC-three component system middle component 6 [unclassified Frankia]